MQEPFDMQTAYSPHIELLSQFYTPLKEHAMLRKTRHLNSILIEGYLERKPNGDFMLTSIRDNRTMEIGIAINSPTLHSETDEKFNSGADIVDCRIVGSLSQSFIIVEHIEFASIVIDEEAQS